MRISDLFIGLFVLISGSIYCQNEGSGDACLTCKDLEKLKLPDVWNLTTEVVEEGTTYCKLPGTISKEINFELLLPWDWNERFVMGGGGGFVGRIQNSARDKVKEGYATVGTDTGHKGSGISAEWAYNNMERQLNYGHLAVHRTAVVAKAIIEEYYCKAPVYNYFFGCSRGGGQAMHEAQRYAEDFDGIVSAAPVISFTATAAEFIQNSQVLFPDPNNLVTATISAHHVSILQKEVLLQCDEMDGIKDSIINDPTDCDFNFEKLPACESTPSDQCFTQQQIEIVKEIYSGPRYNGQTLYPGFPFGGENESGGWMTWIVGPDAHIKQSGSPNLHFAFGTQLCKYLIFNDPGWDYSSYDFSNFEKDTRYAASYLDATSTDYSSFRNRGGKIIFYHGWNDPALSAYTTIEHYESVKKNDPELSDFMRLYLLPGVLHCGGGPGPSKADWVEIVRDWVENENAPEKVVVSKHEDGQLIMERPVFPYPATARYDGIGDPGHEASFRKQK